MQLSKERYQTTHVVLPKGSSKEPIPPPVAHHSPQLYMCGRAEELVVLVGRLSLGRAEGVLCPPPPKKKKGSQRLVTASLEVRALRGQEQGALSTVFGKTEILGRLLGLC